MEPSAAAGNALPRAYGASCVRGQLRAMPEDFQVEEVLGYAPDGEGEHAMLWLEKRGLNTEFLARELACFAGVPPLAVGYAGLKDRHAVTRQMFTVGLAGKPEPDWSRFALDGVRVLSVDRHRRKLKRGGLRGNRFMLRLREACGDREEIERRLAAIAREGIPNYFGEQRFGRDGGNVAKAKAMFAGRRCDRHTRSLLLSAARAEIFNAVLAARVEAGKWSASLPGELWSLAGSRSWFGPEPYSEALAERLQRGDIHPSGPLWGRGPSPAADEAGALEMAIAAAHAELTEGLGAAGLEQERRPLRLIPQQLRGHWRADDVLELSFELSAGAYATTLVRELADSY